MAELKWLEDLLVLIDEQSFTKAAVRRHVTQPAFSRRIRLLEEWLGVPIVDRRRKPVELHHAFVNRENEIRKLVAQIYQLRTSFQDASTAEGKTVFVVQHSLATSLFPELMQEVRRQVPGSSYRIKTLNNDDCTEEFLKSGHFMLCYESGFTRSLKLHDNILRMDLSRDRLLPVAIPEISNRFREEPTADKGRDSLPLLLYPEDQFMGEELRKTLLPSVMHKYRTEVICESAFSITLREMAISGMGLAWLPEQLIQKEIESGTLKSLESVLGTCLLDISLYCKYGEFTKTLYDVFSDSKRMTLKPLTQKHSS